MSNSYQFTALQNDPAYDPHQQNLPPAIQTPPDHANSNNSSSFDPIDRSTDFQKFDVEDPSIDETHALWNEERATLYQRFLTFRKWNRPIVFAAIFLFIIFLAILVGLFALILSVANSSPSSGHVPKASIVPSAPSRPRVPEFYLQSSWVANVAFFRGDDGKNINNPDTSKAIPAILFVDLANSRLKFAIKDMGGLSVDVILKDNESYSVINFAGTCSYLKNEADGDSAGSNPTFERVTSLGGKECNLFNSGNSYMCVNKAGELIFVQVIADDPEDNILMILTSFKAKTHDDSVFSIPEGCIEQSGNDSDSDSDSYKNKSVKKRFSFGKLLIRA